MHINSKERALKLRIAQFYDSIFKKMTNHIMLHNAIEVRKELCGQKQAILGAQKTYVTPKLEL